MNTKVLKKIRLFLIIIVLATWVVESVIFTLFLDVSEYRPEFGIPTAIAFLLLVPIVLLTLFIEGDAINERYNREAVKRGMSEFTREEYLLLRGELLIRLKEQSDQNDPKIIVWGKRFTPNQAITEVTEQTLIGKKLILMFADEKSEQ